VLICAGVNEKDGGATDRDDARGRLKLLEANASVFREVVPEIVAGPPTPSSSPSPTRPTRSPT
jgi:L-lactate dehydrogenase